MSSAVWQWLDVFGGPGHLQRVASDATFIRTQRAYRAYLTHPDTCGSCQHGETQCGQAAELWSAYQAARS